MIFSVVARSPATSTIEFGPNNMPFGLIMKTRPFAASPPRIDEGTTPVTRLSTTDWALGLTDKLDELVDVNAEPLPIDDGLISQLVDAEGLSVGVE